MPTGREEWRIGQRPVNGGPANSSRFQTLPSVIAALESVPDPVSGLLLYKGRGGSAGRAQPRRPRPLIGSGAAALPLPFEPELEWDVFGGIDRRPLTLVAR